jgi:PilZ domain
MPVRRSRMRRARVSAARAGKRFPLHLPIRLKDRDQAEVETLTANVSAAGVYIVADSELKVGSEIEFDITLPGKIIGSDSDVEVRCRGRVVRTADEEAGARMGVGCVIDHYRFVRKK